jgi:hypothetical protein
MGKVTECKHCKEPISFTKTNGKWCPVDPQTNERHQCKSDVECQECHVTFRGSPWMKLCSMCWDQENLDKNRVNRGRGDGSQNARRPERVKRGSHDHKLPF